MAASSAGSDGPPSVPQFNITGRLGAGTYATVYQAIRQGGSREVVAIKCVSKKSLTNTSKENLLKEIELLKTLNHPHIVRLIDFVWDANHIHLILEYCSGGDLLRFIKLRRCLSESLVRRFLQQLALALRYLHSRNVVHMDLKPQNILLTGGDSPKLKIADFGFAHHLKSDSHADQVRGSLLYMAPEIVVDRRYSPKCDLWSVGIILYECLFGRAPFASETHEDLLRKIASPEPLSVPAVQCLAGREVPLTAACQDLLTRLLQRDPRHRADHAAFFGHSFIDLDHAPSAECLEKGKSLALRAVKADSGGELEEAFRLYRLALTYLVPALHYEDSAQKKEQLRDRIYEYMSRAEYLQSEVTQGRPKRPPVAESRWNRLLELCKPDQDIMASLKEISAFNHKLSLGAHEEALALFETCCDKLLELIRKEPEGERRTLLCEVVDFNLSTAENVRKFIRSKNSEKPKAELQKALETDQEMKSEGYNCAVM
ncbi:hypothetical protein BOX15_Mlig008437g1 [Macrostomum lignano]|uniref:Serine/threonine-protein kinase ULK3 n=2 Tax=Macrostomum lignano TaxID=282301 RepID=A0A1I8JH92_9PLAT|nr:hypothetical protein BOX15_Mlig008437g1 [Macrostomum lignano]